MEGLRKGSLFPFPEKGRGEATVPRRFLHPAGCPGQEGPLSDSVGVVSHGFWLPGRGRIPFRDTLCTLPVSFRLQILLASR